MVEKLLKKNIDSALLTLKDWIASKDYLSIEKIRFASIEPIRFNSIRFDIPGKF